MFDFIDFTFLLDVLFVVVISVLIINFIEALLFVDFIKGYSDGS